MKSVQAMDEGRHAPLARWVMVGVVLMGAALSLHQLGTDSLWFDETLTALVAQAPDVVGVLTHLDRWTDVRPLHFLLVHGIMQIGQSEFWLRLPSVGFALLSLTLTYQVGQVLFGPWEGVWAAFLLAQSALFVHYAQEARTYTLLVCLSLLSLYCFERAWRLERWTWWAGFVAASVLNLYTHYFAAFVMASELIVGGTLLLRDAVAQPGATWRQRLGPSAGAGRRLLALVASLAVVGLALLPSAPAVAEFVGTKGGGETLARGLDWSARFWVDVANHFSVGQEVGARLTPLAWLLLGLCLVGLLAAGLQRQYRALFWLLAWTALPFAVLFLIPSQHFFHIRYVLFVLPLLLLATARGITFVVDLVRLVPARERQPVFAPLIALIFAIGFLLANCAPIRAWYAQPRQPWRELAAFFREQMLPGEVLLVEPPWYAQALAYYGLDSVQELNGSLTQFREHADSSSGVWYLSTAHATVDPTGQIRHYVEVEGYTQLLRSEKIENRMSIYYKHQNPGQPRDLLPILQAIAHIDPMDAEVHHLLAEEYRKREQFSAARAEYEHARQLDPDNPRWLVLLGRAWAEEGSPGRGIDLARQGVAQAPQNAWFRLILGDVLVDAGRLAAGLAEYERARELDPGYEDRVWFYMRLGRVYRLQGQTDKAIDAYQQALDLDRNSVPAARWLERLQE